MKTNYLLITCAIAFYMQSCKPPTDYVPPTPQVNCDSTNTVLIPQDMKARFYFKEGTYWIYKNISTGEIDSIWVFYSEIRIEPTSRKIFAHGWKKCYESFDIRTRNKMFYQSDKYYTNYGISLYPIDELNSKNELFGIREVSPVTNFRTQFRIEIIGNNYENQSGFEINIVDSINLSTNMSFRDVLNLNYPNGTSNDMYNEMYYAKNIGLVKFTRSNDNSTWELIRYKINQ